MYLWSTREKRARNARRVADDEDAFAFVAFVFAFASAAVGPGLVTGAENAIADPLPGASFRSHADPFDEGSVGFATATATGVAFPFPIPGAPATVEFAPNPDPFDEGSVRVATTRRLGAAAASRPPGDAANAAARSS